MKLTDPLPHPLAFITRLLMYGLALVIILLLLMFYRNVRLAQHAQACIEEPQIGGQGGHAALVRTRQFAACLYRRSSFIESLFMESTVEHILALPSPSCRYVGVWSSTRGPYVYRHTLTADSRFVSEPEPGSAGGETYTGNWGEHEGKLIWLPDEGPFWPPDINPIVGITATGFTLIERDGARSYFVLVEKLEPRVCKS